MTEDRPSWLTALNEDDLQFVRRFVLASGSLKELARVYSVSYPTVRARLDRLIAKVQAAEESESQDAFERKVRLLVADGELSPRLGKELLNEYRDAVRRSSPRKETRDG